MEIDGFDEFWKVYPRRVGKLAAMKNYKKALQITSPEIILAAAKKYAAERAGEEPKYTKYPEGWLAAGRWDDYQPEPEITITQVLVKPGTPQWEAWTRIAGPKPVNKQGGWYFDSEWPPGHTEAA